MTVFLSYIGPGLGIGTIVLVFVVLLIVMASVLMIIWTPLKKIFGKLSKLFLRN